MFPKLFHPYVEKIQDYIKNHKPFRVGIVISAKEGSRLQALSPKVANGWFEPVLLMEKNEADRALRAANWIRGEACRVIEVNAGVFDGQIVELVYHAAIAEKISTALRDRQIDFVFLGRDYQDSLLWLLSAPQIDLPLRGRNGCGVAVMAMPGYSRMLYVADIMGNADPTVAEKIDIVKVAVEVVRRSGVQSPKVAILAAVEVASPGMPATVEAQEVAEILSKEGIEIQGPLSFDLSVNLEAVRKKKAASTIAGKVDLMIGSNMTVAKCIFQSAIQLCGANGGVIFTGGDIPIALATRSDPMNDFYSLLFGAMMLVA